MTICRHGRLPPHRCLRCSWGAGKPGNTIEQVDDPRLRQVRSVAGRQCLLHFRAAAAFEAMSHDWCSETGRSPLTVVSGWRLRKWPDWDAYVSDLKRRYAQRLANKLGRVPTTREVVRYGRRFLAWESIHFSGLALDLRCHGLAPISATRFDQEGTELHNWLDDYVARQEGVCGWVRYALEPWHLGYHITRPMWESLDSGEDVV